MNTKNNKPIPASQLVFNGQGNIYHLALQPNQLAKNIILVGDPKRVDVISSFFDTIECKVENREIVTHTGTYKGTRISAISTGMGPDNIDIVMTELDALVNIDLKTRIPKEEHTTLNIVRIGTSGAFQEDIPVGECFVVAKYALGLDGLIYFYEEHKDVINYDMRDAFIRYMQYPTYLPLPYVVESSSKLFEMFVGDNYQGITATAPGFYGPQARSLRLGLSFKELHDRITEFRYNGWKIANFEMESSAIYGLGKMLGHETLTICIPIANRVTEKFVSNYQPFMKVLICQVLDRLATIK